MATQIRRRPRRTRSSRDMALAFIALSVLVMCCMVWLVARPLYWRIYGDGPLERPVSKRSLPGMEEPNRFSRKARHGMHPPPPPPPRGPPQPPLRAYGIGGG